MEIEGRDADTAKAADSVRVKVSAAATKSSVQ